MNILGLHSFKHELWMYSILFAMGIQHSLDAVIVVFIHFAWHKRLGVKFLKYLKKLRLGRTSGI